MKVTLHSTDAPDPVDLNLPCTIKWSSGDTFAAPRDVIARGTGEAGEATRRLAIELFKAQQRHGE
ncbi:hypothetical protein [Roseomonas sp. 18066]|uniref:hypothetical protein n=1 Tax=Roseomonas sp. 18066 TaxID=2681412 RepID=UPI00135ACBAB|nr:hypothetical protein [Roseomonas sp. 18066]